MLKFVKGDILTSDCPTICHFVNCNGEMTNGLSKKIKNMYPEVYHPYKRICETVGAQALGDIQVTGINDEQLVMSLFVQDNKSERANNLYLMIKICLEKITELHVDRIGFSFNAGEDVNGDWETIYNILNKYFASSDTVCEIYKD